MAPNFSGPFLVFLKMENIKILNLIGLLTQKYNEFNHNYSEQYKITANKKIIPFKLKSRSQDAGRTPRFQFSRSILEYKIDYNFENYKKYRFANNYNIEKISTDYTWFDMYNGLRVFTFCLFNNCIDINSTDISNCTNTFFPSIFIISSPDIHDIFIWGNDKNEVKFKELKSKFKLEIYDDLYNK